MGNNMVAWLALLAIGIFVGAAVGMIFSVVQIKKFMQPFDAAIANCERQLPRTQSCVIVYEAKVQR